jgi:hypothetical protein
VAAVGIYCAFTLYDHPFVSHDRPVPGDEDVLGGRLAGADFAHRFSDADPVRDAPLSMRFPYGYHCTAIIGYVAAALAVLVVADYLLTDSAIKLINMAHPSLGTISLFGKYLWLGWLMFTALVWTSVSPISLSRAKFPLARRLQDKALYASAKMNKARLIDIVALMIGVAGLGLASGGPTPPLPCLYR